MAEDTAMARFFVAYGMPGYGPSDPENYRVVEGWEDLADELQGMLAESADQLHDVASVEAEAEDYRSAWFSRQRADELMNLHDNLNNERADAPLYRDDRSAWHATIERVVAESFPLDVGDNTRIYVWPPESDEQWAEFTADE